MLSVALSLSVMILSVAIVKGFQKEIRDKVSGFAGHVRISTYDFNSSYENEAITLDPALRQRILGIPGVRSVNAVGQKAGIIKTADQLEGIVLKGVEAGYPMDFYRSCLVQGSLPEYKDTSAWQDVLVSRATAERLRLKVQDPLRVYFITDSSGIPRGRKLRVCGIYSSGMNEFDRLIIVGHLGIIRRLNGWDSDQSGNYEVFLTDLGRLPAATDAVIRALPPDLNAVPVNELYPQIFDWLSLLDANVYILLVLMMIVASVSMISALLILVMERTAMIGILKAMGAGNSMVHHLFLRLSAGILWKGMLAGNLLGLGLCYVQDKFMLIRLPSESYYVSYVPVYLEMLPVLLINLITFVLSMVILFIPSYLLTRISPLRAIRFD